MESPNGTRSLLYRWSLFPWLTCIRLYITFILSLESRHTNKLCFIRWCDSSSRLNEISRASMIPELSYIAEPAASWLDDFVFVNGTYCPPDDQNLCGVGGVSKDCTTIKIFPYLVFYIFFEQYLDIWRTNLINIAVALGAIFIVFLIITSSSSFILAVSVMMVNNLLLKAVSVANLIMSIVIAVFLCTYGACFFC
ncbi:hypothetical protein KPL70_003389 [Citrus sinensis]|uniref:SSD domain-containing protein n=1 Tax=Citrus clementina TaxID=85681 RepID=V4W357_CITCL|nr:hypothetical protein CICLE_v10017739mg [Citrus x clementina]KAH9743694.1 hypothetical protein KPL70_003389 [Citrus sinensis]